MTDDEAVARVIEVAKEETPYTATDLREAEKNGWIDGAASACGALVGAVWEIEYTDLLDRRQTDTLNSYKSAINTAKGYIKAGFGDVHCYEVATYRDEIEVVV